MLKGNVKYLLDVSYMKNNGIIILNIIVKRSQNIAFGMVSQNSVRIRKNVRI